MTLISIKSTVVDQVQVEDQNSCSKCRSKSKIITTNYISAGLSANAIVVVRCAECNTKIKKRDYSQFIKDIATQKKKEFGVSFLRRHGFLIFSLLFVFGGGSLLLYSQYQDSKKTKEEGLINFAKAYDAQVKKNWYEGINSGDYILAAQNGSSDAMAFFVKEIKNDTTILIKYDQNIPLKQYVDLEELNKLELGKGEGQIYYAKTSGVRKGNIEDITNTSISSVAWGYIQQIKKKD